MTNSSQADKNKKSLTGKAKLIDDVYSYCCQMSDANGKKGLETSKNMSKTDILKVCESLCDVMLENLKNGEEVSFFGLFTLSTKVVDGYTGLNPQTKQPIQVPRKVRPRARFGKKLKDAIANTK